MSEARDIVGQLLAAHDGQDVQPVIEDLLKAFGKKPSKSAVMSELEKDEGWRFYASDVVWDMSKTGLGAPAHGVRELAEWWSNWNPQWSEYVYTVENSWDLPGDGVEGVWVLSTGEVKATARNGQSVKMAVWQTWKVENGLVTVMRAFLTEEEARKSVV